VQKEYTYTYKNKNFIKEKVTGLRGLVI